MDVRYRYAADYELWTRFAAHAELHVVTTLLGGFSVWGQNRSRVHHDRYMAEVQRVVENLPELARDKRKTFHSELAAFEHVKHFNGFRWLMRRWMNLQSTAEPVNWRNVSRASYEMAREPSSISSGKASFQKNWPRFWYFVLWRSRGLRSLKLTSACRPCRLASPTVWALAKLPLFVVCRSFHELWFETRTEKVRSFVGNGRD